MQWADPATRLGPTNPGGAKWRPFRLLPSAPVALSSMLWAAAISTGALALMDWGVWKQTEAQQTWLLGLGVCALLIGGPKSIGLPGMMLWTIAAVSMVLLPFSALPLRSWFGSPELGLGGAQWLALAALCLVPPPRWVPWACTLATFMAICMQLSPWPLNLTPNWLVGLGLLSAIINPSPIGFAVALMAVCTGSISAGLMATTAAGTAMLLGRRQWTLLIASAVVILLTLSLMPWESSAYSRILTWSTLVGVVTESPWLSSLLGFGWGAWNDLSLLAPAVSGWEGSPWTAGAFAPHNVWLDFWSALGVPGLVLCGGLFVLISRLSINWLVLGLWAAFAAWSSIWYWLPMHMPFLVLALATLGRSIEIKTKELKLGLWLAAAILAASALVLSINQWTAQRATQQLTLLAWPLSPIWDPGRGHPHGAWLSRSARIELSPQLGGPIRWVLCGSAGPKGERAKRECAR